MVKYAYKGKKLKKGTTFDLPAVQDALQKIKSGNSSERDKATLDLIATFEELLNKLINPIVRQVGKTPAKIKEIKQNVYTEFAIILMSTKVDASNPKKAIAYIAGTAKQRINPHRMIGIMGETPPISGIWRIEWDFRKTIRDYIKKNKRYPELIKSDKDLKDFAKMMDVSRKEVLNFLNVREYKSIYESERPSADDDNADLLIDKLKSVEPLPDEIYQDKELIHLFTKEIKKIITDPLQQKIFLMFYAPRKTDAMTKKEIAKKLKMQEHRVKKNLEVSKGKIMNSPTVKKLLTASFIKNFVKCAMNQAKVFSYNDEEIILEVIKKYEQ